MSKQWRPRLNEHENALISNLRNQRNAGIIGDTHAPFELKGYREFCVETFNLFGVTDVYHAGDEVDNHALSYHESDPDGMSAGHEAERAQVCMNAWYKEFDKVKVAVGNHSALPFRKGMTGGIPKRFLKSYNEIWSAPRGWEWALEWEQDNWLLTHGTGTSGQNGVLNYAIRVRKPTVMGHNHQFGGVQYQSSPQDLIWGMYTGCGIDRKAYAFAYGRNFPNKPTIGCSVILDNGRVPIFVPMPL
jgi:hypothetical protein